MASMIQCSLVASMCLRKCPNQISLVQPRNVHSTTKSTFRQPTFALKNHPNFAAKSREDQWRVCSYDRFGTCSRDKPLPTTPRILISKFFSAINSNAVLELSDVVSGDCKFEGLVFQLPSVEQNITEYFCKVMKARGQNIHFHVDDVKIDNSKANVNWHLEWTDKKIPFTSTSNDFEFKDVAGQLLICKISGGAFSSDLILQLLNAANTVIDNKPADVEGLLSELKDEL